MTEPKPFGQDYVPRSKRIQPVDGKILAGKSASLKQGCAGVYPLDRFTIVLFRVGDEFFAVKDACPHADYPLSKSFFDEKYIIKCSSHSWRFDLRNGHGINPNQSRNGPPEELKLRKFSIEIDETSDEVWIVL
jgi:nitrite reductase/ring-hydroxylating ferredoxin subunit